MFEFKRHITTEESHFSEFFFNRIYTVSGIRYHVTVTDKEGKCHSFNMDKKDGRWHIIKGATVAGWITKVEDELEKAILAA